MTYARRIQLLTGAVAFAGMAAALVTALVTAARDVGAAERSLLREEAGVAVGLLRASGTTTSLDTVFPGRWRLSDDVEPLLDEPVVRAGPTGPVARAPLHDDESWFQVGTLYLQARPRSSLPIPRAIVLTALLGMGLLAALTATWIFSYQSGAAERRLLRGVLLTAMAASLAAPLWEARSWALSRLQLATADRVAVAAMSLALVPDLDSLVARPGGVAQLTGLQFMAFGEAREVVASTLPGAVTAKLATIPRLVGERVTADRVEYETADVGPVRLAALPYDHGGRPTIAMTVLGIVGILVAALCLSLGGLAEERRAFRRDVVAWSFLAPSMLHLIIFTLGPLALAAWLSLHRWSLLDVARPFVGLANYARLLGDGTFWNAIRNTVVFTLHVPASMAVALALALVVHRRVRGIVFLRATLFLPIITSLVAIAMVWQWMLHDEYGLINWLLSTVGLPPMGWLSSPSIALVSIMIMAVWMVVGYQMILFQAGLATIPQELYDAARIDGAGPWRRFIHVTLPGLRHTLFFVLVTSVIGAFQVFGAVYVMTEGGPLRSTDVVVYHIYQEAWEFLRFGDAAAMSWVLFAIIFFVTWLQFRTLEQRAGEGA